MKNNMEKAYVENAVKEMVKKRKAIITKTELSDVSDSILFDWNELGAHPFGILVMAARRKKKIQRSQSVHA